MQNQNHEQAKGWTYAIALTIILAGVSSFLVIKRQEFFPEMYQLPTPEPHKQLQQDSTAAQEPQH